MKTTTARIGIVGLGTVGGGTAALLVSERERLLKRTGVDLRLVKAADIRDNPDLPAGFPPGALVRDYREIVENPDIDIVVELIGGLKTAKDVILSAINNGKHVVTANKALLAEHGDLIFAAAREKRVVMGFEGSVCGGIPVIRALKEGLPADRVHSVYGILNGTANFILTQMRFEGKDFKTALKEAQKKGFAEADPTLDVEGFDTAHKLAILASLAFGQFYSSKEIHVEGITKITDLDIRYAADMGYCVKLVAFAALRNDGRPFLSVAPTLLPLNSILATVNREYNGVVISGHATGQVLLTGRGAGALPTGSAVVSDILHIAGYGETERDRYLMYPDGVSGMAAPYDESESDYYIRLKALDKPGVMAQVSGVLGQENISIATLMQKQNDASGAAIIVIETHKAATSAVSRAVAALNALPVIRGEALPMRIFRHIL